MGGLVSPVHFPLALGHYVVIAAAVGRSGLNAGDIRAGGLLQLPCDTLCVSVGQE